MIRFLCAERPHSRVAVLAALLLCFLALMPQSAQADSRSDFAVASTVRVVQYFDPDGGPYGFGTGIFVTPDRVLTNAHVVRDLRANGALDIYYADMSPYYAVVPATGSEAITARVVAIDEENDLALLSVEARGFLPALLSRARVSQNMAVNAAGYPGNVDRAFSRDNLAAALRPAAPVRTAGVIGSIQGSGYTTDASIGRGYSGGPLLDECGRVVGINRAVTINDAGDANNAITIPMESVMRFLSDNGVSPTTMANPCPTDVQLSSRIAELRDEGEKFSKDEATARYDKSNSSWRRYDECRDDARQQALLIGGILLIIGIGATIVAINRYHRSQKREAMPYTVLAVIILGAIAYLALKPTGCSREDEAKAGAQKAAAVPETGSLSCRFLSERSLNPYLPGANTSIELGKGACVNQRRAYWRDGQVLRYGSLGRDDHSVGINELDLTTGQFRKTRYFLNSEAYSSLEGRLAEMAEPQCTGSDGNQDQARDRFRAISRSVEAPAEILVWNCKPGS